MINRDGNAIACLTAAIQRAVDQAVFDSKFSANINNCQT